MSSLTRYILRQATGPILVFTVVLTLLVWLTQSLQMLDLLINRQQSAGTYATMTLYVLPSLLTVILPFALFCACLYTLNRLSGDSELIVMTSAGLSPWAMAKPMLIIGGIATVLNLMLNLYLMPAGYREMKDKVYEIRSDIASNMVRDGQFTNPLDGLTVYTQSRLGNDELRNVIIHDNRNRDEPKTYLAKQGKFTKLVQEQGDQPEPALKLIEGNVQQMDANGNLTVLYFKSYFLKISEFAGPAPSVQRDLTERFLHELLSPDLTNKWNFRNRDRLNAEGHNRLAAPLYNIAFVLIALTAMTMGSFSRRGYGGRIALALVAGLIVRLAGFGIQSLAAKNPSLVVYQYLVPAFVIFGCTYLLTDMKRITEDYLTKQKLRLLNLRRARET